ncbi:MAG: hypothetical protein ABIL09_11030 [Gemmatimonadota bacterium]
MIRESVGRRRPNWIALVPPHGSVPSPDDWELVEHYADDWAVLVR